MPRDGKEPAPPLREDLRGQLSDIQRRLFKKSDLPSIPVSRPPDPASLSDLYKHRNLDFGSSPDSFLSKPGSSSPSLAGGDPKGNDVKFAVNLSESLLAECRRLTADNKKYKQKLKESLEECKSFQSEIQIMKETRTMHLDGEKELKGRNWDLEATVMSLNEQIASFKDERTRSDSANRALKSSLVTLQNKHDDLETKSSSVLKDYTSLKSSYTREIGDLNTKIEELNDENDSMFQELSHLRSQKPLVASTVGVPATNDSQSKELAESAPSINLAKILKETDAMNMASSVESHEPDVLRSNLVHANHTIERLRSALIKVQSALLHDGSDQSQHGTSVSKLLLKGENRERTGPVASLSKRRAHYSHSKHSLESADETSDNQDSRVWGNFLGDNVPASSISRIHEAQRNISDHANSLPSLDASGSDSEDTTGPRNLHSILANASADLSMTEVESYAMEKGLKIIAADEYDSLVNNDVSACSKDRFVTAGESRGFVVLDVKEYDELIDDKEMQRRLSEKGFVTLTTNEFSELDAVRKSFEKPSVSSVAVLATKVGCVVIPELENEKLQKAVLDLKSPSEKLIREKCATLKLHPLSQSEYTDHVKLRRSIDTPDKEFATEIANKIGLMAISSTLYDDLVRSANEFDMERIQALARDKGQVLVPQEDYKSLKNPSISEIFSLAEQRALAVVPESELDRLSELANNPSLGHLKFQTEKHGLVTLSQKEYTELFKSANEPPVDRVKQFAQAHGMSVVNSEKYEAAMRSLENPGADYIRKKANAAGYEVLPREKYDELHLNSKSPPVEFLNKHASKMGLSLISLPELEEIKKLAFSPSKDQIEAEAMKLDLVCISHNEFERLQKPDLNFLHHRARELEQHVCSISIFEDLESLANHPSIEQLEAKAADLAHSVIETAKLRELVMQNENPPFEVLSERAASLGHVVIDASDYSKLTQEASSPDLNQIRMKAQSHGHEVVESKMLIELKRKAETPDIDHISLVAQTCGLVAIPKTDYDTILLCAKEPSLHHLEEKAKFYDSVVLPAKDLSDIRHAAASPSMDVIKKFAEANGRVIIDEQDLNNLQKSLNEPTLDYIRSHAEDHAHVVKPRDEFLELQNLANNPSADHIIKSAKKHQMISLPASEVETLRSVAKNPTKDTILLTAPGLGLFVLDETDSNCLDALTEKVAQFNSALVDEKEYVHLKEAASRPSLDVIKSTLELTGLTYVEADTLSQLREINESPSIQWLLAKAASHEHSMIPTGKLDSLRQVSENPTKQQLIELAGRMDAAVLPKDEYEIVEQMTLNPTMQQLIDMAKLREMVVSDQKDYELLQKISHSPDVEFLKLKSKDLGFELLEISMIEDLRRMANHPPLDHIVRAAGASSHAVVPLADHEANLRKISHPDLQVMESECDRLGLVITESEEFRRLQDIATNPGEEYVIETGQKLGLAVMPLEKLAEMQRMIDQPTLPEISAVAKSIDCCVVGSEEYESLIRPSPEALEIKANALEHSLISKQSHKKLLSIANSPSVSFIEDHASLLGLVTMSNREHKELLNNSNNPSRDRVIEQGAALGLTFMPSHKHDELLEQLGTPSRTYLESKAAEQNLAVITVADLNLMTTTIENPTREYLCSKASDLNCILLLQSDFDSPTRSYLAQKAGAMGLVLCADEELTELRRKADHPSLAEQQTKAEQMGRIMVKADEHALLVERAENPTMDTISKWAAILGYAMIREPELAELRSFATTPSAEFIEEKASSVGMIAISSDEYDSLKQKAESSAGGEARIMPARLGYKVLTTHEYSTMVETIDSPSFEYLELRAKEIGYKLVDSAKHDAMLEILDTPPLNFLRSKAAAHKHTVISDLELALLHEKIDSPTAEYLATKASALGLTLLTVVMYEEMSHSIRAPTLEFLCEKAAAYQSRIVLIEDHDALKDPSREQIISSATRYGMVVVDKIDYDVMVYNIQSPAIDDISEKARVLGYVVLKLEAYEDLNFRLLSPLIPYLTEHAEKSGRMLLSKTEYDDLESQAKRPSPEHLGHVASLLGMTVMPNCECAELKQRAKYQTVEELAKVANEKDMVLVPRKEHIELVELSSRSLDDHAKQSLYILVDPTVYEALKTTVDTPTVEYLHEKATQLHMKLLHEDEISAVTASTKNLQTFILAQQKTIGEGETENAKLQDQLENPSLSYLKEKALDHDCLVESSEEIGNLRAHCCKSLSELAQDANMIILSNEEHAMLIASAKELTIDELNEKARSSGFGLMELFELSTLIQNANHPTLEQVSKHASSFDQVILPKLEVEELRAVSRESLQEKAGKNGSIVLLKGDFEVMREKLESPSFAYLSQAAENHDAVLVEKEVHRKLEEVSRLPLAERAAAENMFVVDKAGFDVCSEYQNSPQLFLQSRAKKMDKVLLNVEDLRNMEAQLLNPELRVMERVASEKGLVMVPQEEHESLVRKSSATLEQLASEQSMVLLPEPEYTRLQEEASESLLSKATKLDMRVVDSKLFDTLHETYDSPSADHLGRKAQALGMCLVEQSIFDELVFMSKQPLEERAEQIGKVVVDANSFESLRTQISQPLAEYIRKEASKMELTVLDAGVYQELLEEGKKLLKERALEEGMIIATQSEYDELASPSIEHLSKEAMKHDYVLLQSAAYKELKELLEMTMTNDVKRSGSIGIIDANDNSQQVDACVVLPKVEYDELIEEKSVPLMERAQKAGFKLMLLESYDSMVLNANKPTMATVVETASLAGFCVVPKAEIAEMRRTGDRNVKKPSLENGIDAPPSNSADLQHVAQGAVGSSQHDDSQENASIQLSTYCDSGISNTHEAVNCSRINTEFHDATSSRLASDEYMTANSSQALFNILQNYESRQDTISTAEYATANASQETISAIPNLDNLSNGDSGEDCAELGQTLLGERFKEESLQKEASTAVNLKVLAEERGLAIMSQADLLKLKQLLAESESKVLALEKLSQNELTADYLHEQADRREMVLVRKSSFVELKDKLRNQDLLMTPPLSEADLRLRASELNLVIVEPTNTKAVKLVSNDLIDREKLAAAAAHIGLVCGPVVKSEDSTHEAVETEDEMFDAMPHHRETILTESLELDSILDELFLKYATQRGYVLKSEANITSNFETERRTNIEPEITALAPPALPYASPSQAGITNSGSVTSRLSDMTHASFSPKSIATGRFSVGTNMSLTESSMIPAITQIVIGEYLFKYYRRLGAFSAISETRHERYFWVHPYTLTLYWSDDNPSLSDPASVRTRAAAIVSVESVEDNNPLPTGLYYKSIIIHSQNRTIKITCPTRQRHNVWYNALSYLISRNIDEVNFEGDTTMDDHISEVVSLAALKKVTQYDTGERHAFPRSRTSGSLSSQIRKSPSMKNTTPRLGPIKDVRE